MSDIIERLEACTGLTSDFYEAEILEAIAEIRGMRADKEKLIALLAQARGPEGETEERVAEWLRGRGFTVAVSSAGTRTAKHK